ncbi:exocyst complex component EXO70B1-like [Cornus florida]|uniref:exocyst complex component EXO70B1-like n=1 Tax=Cornus florida TaxID=4283 RepID=UPI002899F469|nr:exocyst complex component EXO70B1-like [Cornus florida]
MVFKFLKFGRNNRPPAVESPKNTVPASESAAMELIFRCSSTASGETKERVILNGYISSKIDQYLQAVDKIQQQTESGTISIDDQSKPNSVIRIAMVQLEKEFRVILISLTSPTDTNPSRSSTFSSSITDSSLSYGDYDCIELNPKKKDDLRNIAERMNSARCLDKCIQVYKSVRKTFLHESYRKLGMQNASIKDIRSLDWEALKANIERWILVAKICVRSLFPREKTLHEQIFRGLVMDDACFVEVVKNLLTQLLTSGEAIIICTSSPSRRPEKLFKILELHESVSELLHNFDIIFQSKSFESIQIQAVKMLMQLTEASRDILSEFVTTMLREESKILDNRGSIPSLTRYVMSYITWATFYEEKLNKLMVSKPSELKARRNSSVVTIPDIDLPELDDRTPLVIHLIWIIEILQFKLESKSKHFKDASLAQIFMMNNVHYIVQKIKDCLKLQEMVGDDYLEKLMAVTSYRRSTYDRIIRCFRGEGLYGSGSTSFWMSKSALKDRLKTFNAMFEEVHRTQATWFISDKHLRKQLHSSIIEYLIPAYRSFLELFRRHIRSGSQQEYIKYSVEDLEASIWSLFTEA